jgi:hypothetical protein
MKATIRNMSEEEFNASFKPVTLKRKPLFAVGTKIHIVDKKHPAYGETGRVTVSPREVTGAVRGVWAEVEIDGWAGHECGVKPSQMRELR